MTSCCISTVPGRACLSPRHRNVGTGLQVRQTNHDSRRMEDELGDRLGGRPEPSVCGLLMGYPTYPAGQLGFSKGKGR